MFLSKLLILFQSCNLCFASNPLLSISQSGTMLTIKSTCSRCSNVFTWTSQPHMLGKFPAGNLLLSFAILCSGASINKVLLMFQHMGILVYHYPTYYYHQRHLLVPSIVKYWRGYQAELLRKLAGEEVVFCCTIGYIIHIVLVQVIVLPIKGSCLTHLTYIQSCRYQPNPSGFITKGWIIENRI